MRVWGPWCILLASRPTGPRLSLATTRATSECGMVSQHAVQVRVKSDACLPTVPTVAANAASLTELQSASVGSKVFSVGFSPDGTKVFSGDDSGHVRVRSGISASLPQLTMSNTTIENAVAHGSAAVC